MKEHIAECINIVGNFCGKRDIPFLTREELKRTYRINQADVMVLFGGSIICGGDILAQAIKNKVAKKYVIVGGIGHTTQTLQEKIHCEFSTIQTHGLPEAKVFAAYIKHKYNLEPDLLECNSTNCGNNITYLLEMLRENNVTFNSIIIAQDATMQHRMEAVLRKYISNDITIINYATYTAKVIMKDNELSYERDIFGMWDMDRYITLLMGEIPRLSDDANGYGPMGKNFISHVDIPNKVKIAFSELKQEYAEMIRKANPLYASKNE